MKVFLKIFFFVLVVFAAAVLSVKLSIDHSFQKSECEVVVSTELPSFLFKNSKKVSLFII